LGIDADWRECLLERIKEKRLEQILFLPLQREVSVYFLKENHSKIVITDKAIYVGSANFSFGSNSNFEGGVYLHDAAISNEIYARVFCPLMNRAKRFSGRSRDVESQVKWLVDTTEYLIEILLENFDLELCVLLQQIAGAVDNLKIAFVVHQELFEAVSAFKAPTDSLRRLLEAALDLFREDESLSWRANPDPLQRAFNHLLENSSASNVDALASIASDLSESEIELGSLVSQIRVELHILMSALRVLYEQTAEKDF
jgi:hypothetical protein